MFTTGHAGHRGKLFFMYATMLIAGWPTGVKVFQLESRPCGRGSMTFETPMLFRGRLSCFVFTMGGFTGLILAMAADRHSAAGHVLTSFAHFHYVLVAGSLFGLFLRLLLLVAEVDWRDVQTKARGQSGTSGSR